MSITSKKRGMQAHMVGKKDRVGRLGDGRYFSPDNDHWKKAAEEQWDLLCKEVGQDTAVEWSYIVMPNLDDFTWRFIYKTIHDKRDVIKEGVTGNRLAGEHPDQDPVSITGTST